MELMMDLTPPVHLLRMWMQQKPNYPLLFCEAVDNAFDAAAMRIKITQLRDKIKFEDDGIGILKEKLSAVFTPGKHEAMTSTRLGQFGVGITTQAIAAGNILEVETTSTQGGLSAEVNWKKIMREGIWRANAPMFFPTVVGQHTGTIVTVADLRPAKIVPVERLMTELADRFHPALKEGRSIVLNGTPIAPIPDPRLRDVIEQEFAFDDGRHASLRAGLVDANARRNRVHVSVAHRVIRPADSFACGEYGGIMKMFARLQLSGPWHVTPYKDDLSDESERTELEDTVHQALKPILEKCQAASFNAKIAGVKDLMIAMLPPHLAPARPQATRKKKIGPKHKQKSASEIEPEKSKDESGPARTRRPKSGPLKIDIEGKNEEDGIAGFRKGPPPRINLPPDNPLIATLLKSRDNKIAAAGLLAIVLCVYEHHRRQGELPIEHFGRQVAELLILNPEVEFAEPKQNSELGNPPKSS